MIFASAGLCGITLYYLLENIALTYSMASNVGVIISVAPLFTAILAHFFLDEGRLQANFLLGFTAAISGIFLISYNGSTIFKLNPIGDLLAVMAAVVWAIYSIITRKISTYGYNTIAATRRTFFYGLVFMFPALFIFDFHFGFYRLTNEINIINILFLGLVASALCFVTWNFAVTKLGAVKTSIYIYMVPVITVITSMIVLNEKITPMAAVGTILTLLGLFISERRVYFKKKQIG